jgi:tRNA dimethylallyltransferase
MLISNPNQAKPVALIAGPTASGKTALALALAQRHDVTIINADSAQVYANLPILSAQPSAAELASAPHRLFGYLDGREACSAARWAKDALSEIELAWAANRIPVLVGGTGLYLRTLLDGISPIPEIDAEIRGAVRSLETIEARQALEREDPASAAALAPNDDNRIKRALEVIRFTGKSIIAWREIREGGIGDTINLRPLLLLPPRDWLYDRCNQRFENMIGAGAIEEVAALRAANLPTDAPVLRAIGVPELSALKDGTLTRAEAIELGQIATRQYAKRQYTWFRNQSPPVWSRFEAAYNDSEFTKIERLLQF